MKSVLPSIRRDLLIRLLVTALVPLLVAGAVSVAFLYGHLRDNALEDGDHIALNMATLIRGRLATAEAVVRTLSDTLGAAQQSTTGVEAERLLSATVAGQELFEALYQVDGDLRILATGLPEARHERREDYVGLDLSRMPLLGRALSSGAPLWSDNQLSLVTGTPCQTYCLPFKQGLLVANCTLSALQDLPQVSDTDHYRTLLLDSKGVVLVGVEGRRPSRIIKLDHESLVAEAMAGRPGKGGLRWEGELCLGSTVRIPQTGWIVLSFASRREVFSNLGWMLGLSLLGLVVGVLLASVLSVAMSRRLARPLAVLSGKTAEIAAGQYDARIEGQPYLELEQVASSLRCMGLAIQEREKRQRATEEELRQSQKMEAMGRLVGGIAHDFNNMLQGIRGFAELAHNDLPSEHPVREHLNEVASACTRASELVHQLLIFSRKDNPEPTRLNLNEVLPGALRMLRRVIGEQIRVDFTPCAEAAWILADRTQLNQVLMNLAVNARDAMPSGGRLLFSLSLEPCREAPLGARGCVELAVSDTGHGMTPDVMARVFDPFFTTKEVGQGTGLGLAIVHGIMERSGGMIRVESEPGRGTTFRLAFPRTEAPFPGELAPRSSHSRPPMAVGPAPTGKCILVAEDDVVVRALVASVLRTEGYRALIAADGVQAIDLYDQHRHEVALLLLDVIMPRKSGREVAEHVWRSQPTMPVLFTSGYFTDTMDPASLPPAQAKILRKPYGRDELVEQLRLLAPGRVADGQKAEPCHGGAA